MLSPYSNQPLKPDKLTVEVFIGREGLEKRRKVIFTDEQFEELSELLIEMFPTDIEGAAMDFEVEDNYFEIKEIK